MIWRLQFLWLKSKNNLLKDSPWANARAGVHLRLYPRSVTVLIYVNDLPDNLSTNVKKVLRFELWFKPWNYNTSYNNIVSCLNRVREWAIQLKISFKDIHSVKAPSNKTPSLTKSTNMGIWVVGTSNQLFIRGS